MIRKYAVAFGLILMAFGLTTCGGNGGNGGTSALPSTSTITGSAVKGPVEGAEVHVFYFDEYGVEVEVCPDGAVDCATNPPDPWPVLTDPSGSFSFPVKGDDLMGITSPLIVRTEGGTMYGETAPCLEAVVADPQPLTFARVTVSCPLSAASSVATGLLRNFAQSLGSAPTLEDAELIITQVEDQLMVDLSEDPSDSRTKTGMLNECIDQNLDLPNTPTNNPAVNELIDYLVANLSSSSGLLDDSMGDPDNPGTDIPASFDPFGSQLLVSIVGSDPAGFILMNLASDVTYIENDWTDTADITVTVRDAAGRPYQELDDVQFGLVSGPGILWSAGLSYARGEVLGELTSDATGDTGDILIRAICPLSNNNEIFQEILIQALDFYADEDGDGLSDGDEELERTIFVDVAGFGLTAFADKLVKYDDVTSDPKLSDTDGDGLDDYTEYLLKTHPRMADTDGDGLTDAEEVNRWQTNPLTVDTDFDAGGLDSRSPHPELFDGSELAIYQTSPSLQDTDGDGRTEFEEIFLLNRNPLVSDLPKLEMEITDAVDVRLDVTYAEEGGETYQYGSEMMKSATRSNSTYNENSMNVSITQKVNFSLFSWGSTTFKAGYGHKWSTTRENSNTTQESHSQYTTDSRTRTETAASGSMTAGIRLRNPGDISYTLSKLSIAVRHWEQIWDEDQQQLVKSFKTVATLVPSLGDGITLAPGEETPVFQVEATGLNPDRVKELLKRPDSLYLEDEYFEMENAVGLNYDFLREINLTRTASVVIDPGLANAEAYRVATNVQRGAGGTYPGVTLGEILSDILNVDFATIGRQSVDPGSPTNERVLFRIGDLETNLADPDLGYWTVVLKSENPPAGIYDFEEIPVKAGDGILLVYVRDADGDGANDLLEQNHGTHDAANSDYDGDGLIDYEEVFVGWQVIWTDSTGGQREYDVVSDPANADQDADGLNDLDEKTKGTDPGNPDTDRDGIADGADIWPTIEAKVLYVNKNADGNNDGTSWADAYTDLQDALAKARNGYGTAGDATDDVAEIWVARGVYKPGPAGDRSASFQMVNDLGVFGGFTGSETKQRQRNSDPVQNGTVLSGDLESNDDAEIGEDTSSFEDNSYTVVFADDSVSQTAVLDGFLITGGFDGYRFNPAWPTTGYGGGAFTYGLPTLRNLFFRVNGATEGGGLAIRTRQAGDMIITNCIFAGNTTIGQQLRGGGIFSFPEVFGLRLILRNCTFRDNSANYGGGLHALGGDQSLSMEGCSFNANNAVQGGASDGLGAAVFVDSWGQTDIDHCKFIGNRAEQHGGAIYITRNTRIEITQSIFVNNEAEISGGGLFSFASNNNIWVINSVVANNRGEETGGGLRVTETDWVRIENSIVWGNISPGIGDDQHLYNQIAPFSHVSVKTSNIQNGNIPIFQGYGNIFEDPKMVNASAGDVRLSGGSPCIDAGNSYIDFEPMTPGFTLLPDLDPAGNPRIVDGDGDGGAEVDMGAYEYQP
jgi:predicted outer membrane repeat protein